MSHKACIYDRQTYTLYLQRILCLNIQDILVAYPAKTDMFSHVGFL